MKHLTGYVGGIFRSEKHKTGGDFFRLAGPTQRCIGTKCRHFIGREGRWDQRRPNWSRRDRVYPDLLVHERLRQGASEGNDPPPPPPPTHHPPPPPPPPHPPP